MNATFSVDFETLSFEDLQAVGADGYLRAARTRVAVVVYHLVGSPDPPRMWLEGDPVPPEWVWHVDSGGSFAAWNGNFFDRVAYNRILVPQWGFPEVANDAWVDSMHRAAHANLPRALDACAKAVGLGFAEDLKDKARIRRITNLNVTPVPALMTDILNGRVTVDVKLLEDMRWLADRCVQDVIMEEGVLLRLPPWPTIEPWLNMPAIDRKINDRGILLDVALVKGLIRAAEVETHRLDLAMNKLTDKAVPACTNIEKLKLWLIAGGVELPRNKPPENEDEAEAEAGDDDDEDEKPKDRKSEWRLRKSDIADLIARDDVPEDRRLALLMRMERAKASVSKLTTLQTVVSPDGRLRNSFNLMGAQANRRWSAGKAQLHNFIRDSYGNADEIAKKYKLNRKTDKSEIHRLMQEALAQAIEVGRSGDADVMRRMYETPRTDARGRTTIQGVLPWISRMMRRTLCAQEGMLLMNGDYANIEARIPVWLSGQEDVVDAFARGEDVYRKTASMVYNIPPEQLTHEQRQMGKCMVLFLNFLGGVNAFVPAAMNYGVSVSREVGQGIVNTFRETNSKLVAFGDANLQAAVWAVTYPGQEFHVPPKGLTSWIMRDNCLTMRLPSGNYLRYWAPQLEQGYWPDGGRKRNLDLTAIVIKGRAALRRPLWRGLVMQNTVSAIAAEMLGNGLINMDKAGIPVTLHVHDSIAAEENEESVARMLPVFEHAMLDQPAWTKGLPVAVSVDASARFG